jgi:hypothetical protein
MPAGCQRSDKRRRHGTPPFPTHCVAGIYDFGGIGRCAAERKDKDCRSGDQRSIRKRAGRMPAILKYNFLYDLIRRPPQSSDGAGRPQLLNNRISNIRMTNIEVKFLRNSFTTANAVQGVRRPSVAKAMEGRQICARAVTLSPHSGECFRIRNKTIKNEQTLKFLYD